jgi:hypothetical protein
MEAVQQAAPNPTPPDAIPRPYRLSALYELSQHLKVQTRLRSEIHSVLGRNMTQIILWRMNKLKKCITWITSVVKSFAWILLVSTGSALATLLLGFEWGG